MITDLKKLWQQAFHDPEDFIDTFFATAYAPDRCQYLTQGDRLAAMLYWFDCTCRGQKNAYIYAVATDKAYQNRGLCRRLMEMTHAHLQQHNYAGAILVPGSKELFSLYEKLGYRTCSYVSQLSCAAAAPVPLRPITKAEYAALRRALLPEGGVVQEGAALDLLEQTAGFYVGDGIVLAATIENTTAHIHELLGSTDPAGVVAGLGAENGHIRMPGNGAAFAMYCPFTDALPPAYFGLALD